MTCEHTEYHDGYFGYSRCENNETFALIRNNSIWEDREDLSNVYWFFEYHYNYSYPEDECAWRYLDLDCDEISFSDGPCSVGISYSPCNETDFYCWVTSVDSAGITDYEDCTADFEDYEFWSMMREEQFWENEWEEH